MRLQLPARSSNCAARRGSRSEHLAFDHSTLHLLSMYTTVSPGGGVRCRNQFDMLPLCCMIQTLAHHASHFFDTRVTIRLWLFPERGVRCRQTTIVVSAILTVSPRPSPRHLHLPEGTYITRPRHGRNPMATQDKGLSVGRRSPSAPEPSPRPISIWGSLLVFGSE